MNYTDNKSLMRKIFCFLILIVILAGSCTACSAIKVEKPDSSFFINECENDNNYNYLVYTSEPKINVNNSTDFLYSSVCYSSEEITGNAEYEFTSSACACYNVTKATILYSKGIYDKIYPASTTKLLTALLAVRYGNIQDEIFIAEDNCGVVKPGAKLCGFKKGDVISLEELIKCLMVYSGNDAAVAIGEYISGDMDSFMNLMNNEAKRIGATDTNFSNAHGLHDINHYTTAYDMYLIFNECIQNEFLMNIMRLNNYTAYYKDINGNDKELFMESTDLFLTGTEQIPEEIKVYGGKTGVTPSAGNCLIICCENSIGDIIITEVFNAATKELQYGETRELMKLAKPEI